MFRRQMPLRTFGWVTLLAGLTLVAACGDDGKKTTGTCGDDGDCQGGACYQTACYLACEPGDDCGADHACQTVTSDAGNEADLCLPVAAAAVEAPASLAGKTLVLIEQVPEADPITNTWRFADDADTTHVATLAGAAEFSFTYEVSEDTSTLVFDVDGQDTYQMTWTSATGGTCTEQFMDQPAHDCTFSVTETPVTTASR